MRIHTFVPRAAVIACLSGVCCTAMVSRSASAADKIKEMQTNAVDAGHADWAHWGNVPTKYSSWTSHSNRLIPAYTFGIDLAAVRGEHSVYRDAERLTELYGFLPEKTLNPQAEYFDQTDIAQLQLAALAAGKKHVVLIVFDGMDWNTTRAAAIYKTRRVGYDAGRGSGLSFLDYRGATTDFGVFVTSPQSDSSAIDVNAQTVLPSGAKIDGGYCPTHGGLFPWMPGDDPDYLIAKSRVCPHAVTDSASSATSLCAGIKTYNVSINIDPSGKQVAPVAHKFQEQGFAVGVVTSVPISHATPACAYAHNVSRDDFQDLTRDLLGLPSVAHRQQALPGVDVLIGAGWGETVEADSKQGTNFVPGNKYLTAEDQQRVSVDHGGKYRVVERHTGQNGKQALLSAAQSAAEAGQRLLGYFGAKTGHLPFATADGNFDPTVGVKKLAEVYSVADIDENPTLADMTRAALVVLERNPRGFWLMVEAGDVDWANHDNNIDNSIGAVLSGDAAFRTVIEWVEARQGWADTAVILTADHGHYLHLVDPGAIAAANEN